MSTENYNNSVDISALRKNLRKIKKSGRFGKYKDMAAKVSISDQHLSDIVNGRADPSDHLVELMTRVFEIPRHEIFFNEPKVSDENGEYKNKSMDEDTSRILDELLDSGDEEIIGHLKRQVLLLKDLLVLRKEKKRKD